MSLHRTGSDGSEARQVSFEGVYMAGKHVNTRWNVSCQNGLIHTIDSHDVDPSSQVDDGIFIAPSLCHPHIHLDKCFLLQHPKYADLKIQSGDFAEALQLTNEAKSRFEHCDLMERGRALIEESIGFGVTHMRAFVEVDFTVRMKCLAAGLELKEEFRGRCYVQLCVFAQDPVISYDDKGVAMKLLLEEAVAKSGVDAFGSTPYVEKAGNDENMKINMEFAISIAKKYKLHLDFHIDYNLDPKSQPWVLYALDLLRSMEWPTDPNSSDFRTVTFGHCTRLTLFDREQWSQLRQRCGALPVSFVGLPTSDIFMMGRPEADVGGGQRVRGTLQVPQIIKAYGLSAAIGINNVGNAFTPQGSCDPLSLASLGVGVYQAGTRTDADILHQCVSSRAKAAIGLHPKVESYEVQLRVGEPADFVVFGSKSTGGPHSFRTRKTSQDLIYDAGQDRSTVLNGQVVSR